MAEVQTMNVVHIPTEAIRAGENVRHELSGIAELAASIRSEGLLQPLVVRKVDEHYEVIAGHRRLQAILALGWESAPCLIRDTDGGDTAVLQLVENTQRQDLSALEVAEGLYSAKLQFGMTNEQIAHAVGKSSEWVRLHFQHYEYIEELRAAGMSRDTAARIPVFHLLETLGMSVASRREVLEYAVEHDLTRKALRERIANHYARLPPRGNGKRTPNAFEGMPPAPDPKPRAKTGKGTAPASEAKPHEKFSILVTGEVLRLLFTSERKFTEVLEALQRMGGQVI